MYLTIANLAYYLIERGFITNETVVAGDFVVLDASRRNRNFKVVSSVNSGLFIKQMREMQVDAMETLRREALCVQRMGEDAMLARLTPRLRAYDADRHVLIMELLDGAESLAEYHSRENTWPAGLGRMLGEGLGLYHTLGAAAVGDKEASSPFPRQTPVVLTWQKDGHAIFKEYGRIGPALSAVIQEHPEFQALLDAVGAEWRFDSLIHGDLKWDNVLIFPNRDGVEFRIVDWELADIGDADWDVGAVLQSFLTTWILSMPIGSGLPPEHFIAMATRPIEQMRPVLSDFWEAYCDARGLQNSQRRPALERCMRFAAARLVWSVVEQRVYAGELDATAFALLQVSRNILEHPGRAVEDILNQIAMPGG